jgi:hypothetical protein
MKTKVKLLILISISAFALSSNTSSKVNHLNTAESESSDTITVNFEFGEHFSTTVWSNIYVTWMENTSSDFIQNISICQKLVSGGLTGIALPYWKINKYPQSESSEVDAVTSATIANADFSVTAVLKDPEIRNFVLYFEVDRSYEPNDWFSDQPALLYAANINLDDEISEYELSPVGWTPNAETENKIANTPSGQLQSEMKYITNFKDGSSFGDADERTSTRMVKKITALVKSSVPTGVTTSKNDFSISVYPNPTNEQIKIKSTEKMNEVIINNIQGQVIHRSQPNSYEATITFDKNTSPTGTYFIKVETSKGTSTHKILVTE